VNTNDQRHVGRQNQSCRDSKDYGVYSFSLTFTVRHLRTREAHKTHDQSRTQGCRLLTQGSCYLTVALIHSDGQDTHLNPDIHEQYNR
jgi:hypothetical protein